jgi:hypothetical protein
MSIGSASALEGPELLEFAHEAFEFQERIGHGSFGAVYLALEKAHEGADGVLIPERKVRGLGRWRWTRVTNRGR